MNVGFTESPSPLAGGSKSTATRRLSQRGDCASRATDVLKGGVTAIRRVSWFALDETERHRLGPGETVPGLASIEVPGRGRAGSQSSGWGPAFALAPSCPPAPVRHGGPVGRVLPPCAHHTPESIVTCVTRKFGCWHEPTVPATARVGPEVGVELKIAFRSARPSAMEGRPSVAGMPSAGQPLTRSGTFRT